MAISIVKSCKQSQTNMEHKDAERAITKFICGSSDRYRYSYQMLNEWVIEIEALLNKCESEQIHQILNSQYCDDNAYEPSPNHTVSSLLRLLIVRIHNQCEIKPQLAEIKNKIRSLCKFTSRLISFGLAPMLPFKHYTINNPTSRIFNGQYYGFSPRQSSEFEYNGYTIFNKLSESIDFCTDANMSDIYALVFDITSTFKQEVDHPNNARPAIITLPIWIEDEDIHYSNNYPTRLSPPSLRRDVREKLGIDLHAIWLCGSAFLSMYGGSPPTTKGDFTPSVLALALDKLSQYPDQKLFRFMNMNAPTTTQYTLLPLCYDHKFVLQAEMKRAELIKMLKLVLDNAYEDVIVRDNGFYPHYAVVLYFYLVKKFYDVFKAEFYGKLKKLYADNKESMTLIYDIVHKIVNEYYFEDLAFVETELDRTKLLSVWLTQLRKFSKEWQDWMATYMFNGFRASDIGTFRELLAENYSISTNVVTGYKNQWITRWILGIYSGYLDFEQMIDILCEHDMEDPSVLRMVFNEERINFNHVRVGPLFKYVLISLILKSKYEMDESLMKYMFSVFKIYKGNNCRDTVNRMLQKVYLTLCQFPSRSEEKLQINNIRAFLMELKLNKEFRIDFDRGFIECVNFQNQNRPNIEVLQLLFDLDLLDQEECRRRTYLQHSILFENTDILAIISNAWKH